MVIRLVWMRSSCAALMQSYGSHGGPSKSVFQSTRTCRVGRRPNCKPTVLFIIGAGPCGFAMLAGIGFHCFASNQTRCHEHFERTPPRILVSRYPGSMDHRNYPFIARDDPFLTTRAP